MLRVRMRTILKIFCFIFFISSPIQYVYSTDLLYQCPQRCQCITDIADGNFLTITCHFQKIESRVLQSFPYNKTRSLTILCSNLNVEENDEFEPNMFNNFNELQELKISNCQSKKLTENTFKGMPKLKSLHLNQINDANLELENKVFLHLLILKTLVLTNSSLKKLPNRAICSLRFLHTLNLSYNNLSNSRLGIEPDDCLLKHLNILDISNNKIRHISSSDFNPFSSLSQLNLANNGLREIEFEAFKPLSLIQHINLNNNQLRELAPLPDSLLHLNLAQNRLKLIPATVSNLVYLTTLNISGNFLDSNSPFSLLSNIIGSLDMSNNLLADIPIRLFKESSESLLILNLAGNNIKEIDPYTFQNVTNLKILDLSNNKIRTLENGIFDNLKKLETLQLNNNSIYHIESEVFRNMSEKLTILGMSHNLLTELPRAIERLIGIKNIDFSHNQISKAVYFVINKIQLTKLDLSNNNMENIENYVFYDSSYLTDLNLRNNRIQNISDHAFEKCPRLKKIILSDNNLTSLNGVLRTISSLKIIDLSNNTLSQLDWNEFPEELNELYAGNNQIQSITEAGTSKTKILKLNNNMINNLSTEQLPQTLEQLDVGANKIEKIPKNFFLEKTHLQSLNISENFIKSVPGDIFEQSVIINNNILGQIWLAGNPLECNCEMSWIQNASERFVNIVDISVAKCRLPLTHKLEVLSNATSDAFLCNYENICEPGCICCKYGSCDCKSKCPNECECYHDNSLKINVVKCHGTNNDIEMKDLPMHASHIFINEINLPILKSHDFSGRSRLLQLHITSSNLSVIQPLAFNTLTKLKVLNLAGNKLQKINGDEAFKTERVEKLNIQQNKIKSIDKSVTEMLPNLEDILVNDNDLEKIPDYLENEKALKKLKIISIGNNPLRCDCSRNPRLRTHHWFIENYEKIIDTPHIYCVENITRSLQQNDSTILSFYRPNLREDLYSISIQDFIQQENRSICVRKTESIFGGTNKENTFLIMILAIFILLIVMAVLCLCITSFKKEKDSHYRHRYKKTNSLNVSAAETPTGYSPLPTTFMKYNVFISYSKIDEEEMFRELWSPLIGHDLTLCLLHKDGPQYNGLHLISDELNKQVMTSHFLIIFLTKSFLENEWRTLQIKTSHQYFAKSKGKGQKLIAIISDEVNINELDNDLGQILRRNVCIKRDAPNYWDSLLSELRMDKESAAGSETSQIYSDVYSNIVPSEIL